MIIDLATLIGPLLAAFSGFGAGMLLNRAIVLISPSAGTGELVGSPTGGTQRRGVALLTAMLFAATWSVYPGLVAVPALVFIGLLVCAIYVDLDHLVIPDILTIGGTVVGIVLSACFPSLHRISIDMPFVENAYSVGASLAGATVGSGLILWIALITEALLRKETLGFGDVKFMGVIGAFCGWKGAVFALFGGSVVGCVWVAAALVWQRACGKRAPFLPRVETPDGAASEIRAGAQMPFGPMLAVAALVYFLFFRETFDGFVYAMFGV